MRALGLDIGSVRVGVAISDPSGTVAAPLAVLDARKLRVDPAELRRIVAENDVDLLVVGLPLTMAGQEGPQARAVREAAERLGHALGLPVEFVDERLSTAQAAATMRAGGAASRKQRGRLDKVAATLVLQAYLDAARGRCSDGRPA